MSQNYIPQLVFRGKPYITVSPRGISNGLSDTFNDGADFGPDTLQGATAPGQYGPPYSNTSGIQEAGNYVNSTGGGIVFLEKGIFLIDTNINGSNWNGVSIIGSGSNITASGVSNAFGNGTVIAPSNNWSPAYTLTNFLLPGVGYYNYSPLIYVIGTGATGNPTGTNLEFKDFLISGINTLNGSPFPDTMGLYMRGIWNLVVDHVDTQLLWWGKYFDLNGPSGNSNWFLNSTDINTFDVAVFWRADLGAMVNIDVMTVSNGHVQSYNSNFSGYAYIITGVDVQYPAQASNISYQDSSLMLGPNASVTNVTGSISNTTPAVILSGSYSSFSGFSIFSNGPNSPPIFTSNQPNGPGISPTNVVISGGAIVPSGNSTSPSVLYTGEINANSVVGNEVLFSDITLGTGSGKYWASPIFSASGTVNPIKFKNVQGLNLYYTPTLAANPPASGTVYQNLTFQDIIIYLPVYASTSGTNGSVAVALGTSSSPSTIYTKFVSGSTSSSAPEVVTVEVPAGWYYSFTGTGVTFGTSTVEPA